MPSGLFVTGTDTGVGKTAVAAALARLLVEQGVTVRPRKPVESGCERDDGGHLVPRDARQLSEAAGNAEPLSVVCPHPFEAALSPERAAAAVGQRLALHELRAACLDGVGEHDFVVVEGAGGFLTPLAPDALAADLAASLHLPVLLVIADRLGCLNHALLTVEVIERRGLSIAAIALNRLSPAHPAGMDNAADLHRWLGREVIELPYAAVLDAPWEVFRGALSPLATRLASGRL
jgi:dethiobiotin synthetase